jgi:putative copper export protein
LAQDPYKPPASRVEDVGEDEELAGRPPQVTYACRLLWAVLVIDLLSMHPAIRGDWWGEVEDEDMRMFVYGGVALVAVLFLAYGFLIYLVGRRNDVARWLLLLLFALGAVATVGDFAETLEETPWAAAVDGFSLVVELWACYLLFLSPGAAWFRRRAPQAPA